MLVQPAYHVTSIAFVVDSWPWYAGLAALWLRCLWQSVLCSTYQVPRHWIGIGNGYLPYIADRWYCGVRDFKQFKCALQLHNSKFHVSTFWAAQVNGRKHCRWTCTDVWLLDFVCPITGLSWNDPEFGIVYMVKIVRILKRLDDDWYVWCKTEQIL